MKNTIILILSLQLISCGHPSSETTQEKLRTAQFKTFLKKFKILSLPFAANTSCYSLDTTVSVKLNSLEDSLFVDPRKEMAASIGIFPDTSSYYALIYCSATVCWNPQIAVFSKAGNLISKEMISQGCGSDVGYTCLESITINSLANITETYIEESFEYDSLSKEIPGTWKRITQISRYSIDSSGKIKETREPKDSAWHK